MSLTSPGYTPQNDESKGIFVHTAGSAYGSDMTEESVRRMAMGRNSNSLASGLGSFLGGIMAAIGGVFAGIAEALSSAFGSKAEGTLTGNAAAAFEALKPLVDEVLAAKEFVEAQTERAEQAHQETLKALEQAVSEVEKMRIDGDERRKLAEAVAAAETEEGKVSNAVFEVLRLLSLANSRSLDQNEIVDQRQNEILQELAETDAEIIQVQREQVKTNQKLAAVDSELERTLTRFLYCTKDAPTGLSGYLQAPVFQGDDCTVRATGNWTGQVVVMLRATNGAVDFGTFSVDKGRGYIKRTAGGIILTYDAAFCMCFPR